MVSMWSRSGIGALQLLRQFIHFNKIESEMSEETDPVHDASHNNKTLSDSLHCILYAVYLKDKAGVTFFFIYC